MLEQRVITAIVLLTILLPALFYVAAWPLLLLALLLLAAGGWEWGRLCGLGPWGAVCVGAACVALCVASWVLGWVDRPLSTLWLVGSALWLLAVIALLGAGAAGWSRVPRSLRLYAGVLALWLAWLALAQARQLGVNFLLSVLLLVWVADSAAYFAGRAFGGRRLAPSISPGKSWAGVWGALAGVLALALLWLFADAHWQMAQPSFYTRMAQQGVLWLLLVVPAMLAMAVCGDLLESIIKRSAGVKDSSALLSGHGGVLDRIDALLPTLPLALMLTRFTAPT